MSRESRISLERAELLPLALPGDLYVEDEAGHWLYLGSLEDLPAARLEFWQTATRVRLSSAMTLKPGCGRERCIRPDCLQPVRASQAA